MMEGLKNRKVKIYFKNATTCEGVVADWDNEGRILLTSQEGSLLIIHHAEEDMMMTQVFAEDKNDQMAQEEIEEEVEEELTLEQEEPIFINKFDEDENEVIPAKNFNNTPGRAMNFYVDPEALVEDKIEEVIKEAPNHNLKIKKLAELRAAQKANTLVKLKKTFSPGNLQAQLTTEKLEYPTKYEHPAFKK